MHMLSFLERRLGALAERMRAQHAIPLRLELWNGQRFDLASGTTVTVSIPHAGALRLLLHADLYRLGEAFVEGHIQVRGPIHEVFRVAEALAQSAAKAAARGTRQRIRSLFGHSRGADRKAIEYHYDVSNDFYGLFLDREMVYSCAYYRNDRDDLDLAQAQKLDYILGKLRVARNERFLDIGCGWGALIMRAARRGAIATGVTISENQYRLARERISAAGLEDRCRVELLDYRDIRGAGAYDKIASVGMFEHVGLRNLPGYFARLRSLLAPGGLLLNHGITSSDPDSRPVGQGAGAFIERYVFPQGELPHLALVLREMARAGFEVADVESLRRHYARTCHQWASRLESRHEEAVRIAGGRRVRIWEIYLAGCAYGFGKAWMNIYQILAAVAPAGPGLPMTREDLYCVPEAS